MASAGWLFEPVVLSRRVQPAQGRAQLRLAEMGTSFACVALSAVVLSRCVEVRRQTYIARKACLRRLVAG